MSATIPVSLVLFCILYDPKSLMTELYVDEVEDVFLIVNVNWRDLEL